MSLSTRQKLLDQLMAIQEKQRKAMINKEILKGGDISSEKVDETSKMINKIGQQLLRKSKGGN